jgi:hypothetical protein
MHVTGLAGGGYNRAVSDIYMNAKESLGVFLWLCSRLDGVSSPASWASTKFSCSDCSDRKRPTQRLGTYLILRARSAPLAGTNSSLRGAHHNEQNFESADVALRHLCRPSHFRRRHPIDGERRRAWLAASLRVAQSDGHPEADPRILLALSLTRRLSTRTTRAPLAPAEQYWVAGAF